MSTTHSEQQDEAGVASSTARVPAQRTVAEAGAAVRRRASNRRLLAAGAALLAVGGFGVVQVAGRQNSPAPAPAGSGTLLAPPTAALALPATVAGLNPAPATSDPVKSDAWKALATGQVGAVPLTGTTYQSPDTRHWIRVVAARTDLTGKLEMTWAADAGTPVGGSRCTNNTIVVKGSAPRVRPTVMVCWRVSKGLSVYAIEVDPRATKALSPTAAAGVVDSVWRKASQG